MRAVLSLSLALAACQAGDAPCGRLAVWQRASTASAPALLGSWDGFARPGRRDWTRVAAPDGSAWWRLELELPAAVHRYALYDGLAVRPDEHNPRSTFIADPLGVLPGPYAVEVSEIDLSSCAAPAVRIEELRADASSLRGRVSVSAGLGPPVVELRRGDELLPPPAVGEEGGALTIGADGLTPGKYTLTVSAGGVRASGSAFVEARSGRQLEDGFVYQILVDRFRGPGPLAAPATPGDRAGGTLDGVTELVEDGYFERLGVTTLWLSPVYENPTGRLRGRDGRPYEAYHGYWPIAPRGVEPRLGGEAALDRLIAAAHRVGLRVVLDAVPNHVHEGHPYYRAHSLAAGTASWFHDGPDACVCGVTCSWATRMEDCWFDTYLPDLELRDPEVVRTVVDDLLFWQARFDLDGFRIDAVPMMPRAALRQMTRALRAARRSERLDALLLGETYTGPGDAGRTAIASYLGLEHDGLDSEFDFPLLWAARDVLAHGLRGMDELEAEIAAGDRAWAGSGAVIARTIGNHDTTRFASESVGDAGGGPWTRAPRQPEAEAPYRRQLLALALMLTLPGLPVLYYGDELGLAGGADPDSRRVLPDVLGPLPAVQARLLDAVARLGRARRCAEALRRGTRRALLADRDHLISLHEASEAAIVALSRAPEPSRVRLEGLPPGVYRDVLSDARVTVPAAGLVELSLPPLSAGVYLPESSRCHE